MSEGEIKHYMSAEKKKTLDEISANIEKDKEAINEQY